MREVPAASLKLVGDGPLRAQLTQQAESLGITASVEFCGARTDVAQLLAQSGLFVLPSREEGLSIALLEALAQALPVVASDIPGNRILITHGQTGFLFKPCQADDLSATLVHALQHPAEARSLATAGRCLVHETFSIQAVARQHVELFRQLITEHKA